MRYFNTSGPNNPKQHYTIERTDLIGKGHQLVQQERYFTIWAPRQTGKSTYFRQLSVFLQSIVREGIEDFEGTNIQAYIIPYDEDSWD